MLVNVHRTSAMLKLPMWLLSGRAQAAVVEAAMGTHLDPLTLLTTEPQAEQQPLFMRAVAIKACCICQPM